MIAFYELNTGAADIFSPTQKKFVLFIHAAVKKIADDYELRRPEKLDLGKEPLQIFAKNILRDRNAALAEMPAFTQMQVGKDQGFFFFPKNRSVCRKQESVIKDFVWNKSEHRAANVPAKNVFKISFFVMFCQFAKLLI